LENKDLDVKSLFLKDLGPHPLHLRAPGWVLLHSAGVARPIRPDQKVKLDKTGTERGPTAVIASWLIGL